MRHRLVVCMWTIATMGLLLAIIGSVRASDESDLIRLADEYHGQFAGAKYDAAEQTARKMRVIAERSFKSNGWVFELVVRAQADVARVKRQYATAEKLYLHALNILQRLQAADHPTAAFSLSGLAIVYKQQRRYAEAETLFKRALAIREKATSPEHPDVGHSLSSLAFLYVIQGRHAEAEPLLK